MRIIPSLIAVLLAMLIATASMGVDKKAYLVDIEGAIGPVTHDLISRTIADAEADSAALIVLLMDTPGGLDHSMRNIITNILDSDVPVITYVSPSGSRAASAGTYILYASHIAAMAPATNLGAATPVQIGGMPKMPQTPDNEKQEPAKTTMEKKIINDASAYIKGLAQLRGRNEKWAEQAVREGVSLTSEEALEQKVIDLMANNVTDLFQQLQGREIDLKDRTITLDTQNLLIERIKPDWRSKLLSIITDPNLAYILMLVGIYGLIIEFSNPGLILPGVLGTICLLLALYAFQVLPINYAGLALVAVGLAFIVGEVFVTSGGILGLGGVIAFVIGSIILFDDEYIAVSLPLIGGIAAIAAGFMLWIMNKLAAMRHKKVVSGLEYMVGLSGEVIHDFTGKGRVRVDGESWLAECAVPLTEGEPIRVVSADHLVLTVQPTAAVVANKEDS